jgi:hypothetical protein
LSAPSIGFSCSRLNTFAVEIFCLPHGLQQSAGFQ